MNRRLIIFSAMGIELVGGILGGIYLGQLLDTKFSLGGIGVMSLSIAVLVGWFVRIILLLKRLEKMEPSDSNDSLDNKKDS